MKKSQEAKSFSQILGIIRTHRAGALASVNIEHLLSRWEIGAYLSVKIKHDGWGQATIDRLVDYIHANAPDERGYGRSNLYNMVSVYETFTMPDFIALLAKYGDSVVQMASGQVVQMPSAQIAAATKVQPAAGHFPPSAKVQPAAAQLPQFPFVQSVTAQIVQSATGQFQPMPAVLALTTFTNLVEILNRTRTAQERLFYIVYAFRERLNKMELRKRLVDDAYSAVLGGGKKNFSKVLKKIYPSVPAIIPDAAIVDFLHLPPKHTEARLRKGIVSNMKEFILSIGRDFLFVGEEFPVKVGGSEFHIDLLFYHRALRCLVAFELKARPFRPSDMGQLEFYLEALDRDVKRGDENPSIGVLLCKSADHSMVEYALSRTMSPAMVAEYKRVMIPREVLQETFDRYVGVGGAK